MIKRDVTTRRDASKLTWIVLCLLVLVPRLAWAGPQELPLFTHLTQCQEATTPSARIESCEKALIAAQKVRALLQENRPEDPAFFVSGCDSAGSSMRCATKRGIIRGFDSLITVLEHLAGGASQGSAEDLSELREHLIRALSDFYAVGASEMSVVLRGGLSLGNYQAGFLYYSSEFLKAKSAYLSDSGFETRRGFATVAGASAGGLNAVLSSVDSCLKPQPNPESSLYFKGWTRVGIFGRHGKSGLVVEGRQAESDMGILSQRPLEDASAMLLETAGDADRLERSCKPVNLGLTITRLAPETFSLYTKDDGELGPRTVLGALKQAEKMLFELEFPSRGGGREEGAPLVSARPLRPFIPFEDEPKGADPRAAVRQFYLALGHGYKKGAPVTDRSLTLRDLLPVLQATSSFPVAFPPGEIDYTRIGRDGAPGKEETALFVDGGIFDNTPLGLAITVDRWADDRRAEREFEAGGSEAVPTKSAWMDPRERSCLMNRRGRIEPLLCDVLGVQPREYLFLEPDVVDWEPEHGVDESGEANERKSDILSAVTDFAGSFLGTSMGAALVETVHANPFIIEGSIEGSQDTMSPRLLVPERHLPLASSQLANFMGFFEQDFRVFDFYVGMVDAERFFKRDRIYMQVEVPVSIQSRKYACMRDYYEWSENKALSIRQKGLPASCRDLTPKGDKAILAGIDDLPAMTDEVIHQMDEDWSASGLTPSEIARREAVSRKLEGDNFRALLVAMHNYKIWMISDRYNSDQEFTKFFEILEDEGFTFVDMQRIRIARRSKINTGERARLVVRDLMQRGVVQLARAQTEFEERVKVRLLGGVVADLYEPRPSWASVSLGLNFNGMESYFGLYLGHWRRFRLDVGGRFYQLGMLSYTDPDDNIHRFFKSDIAAFTRLSFAVLEGTFARMEFGVGFIGSELLAMGQGLDKAHVTFRYGPEFTGSLCFLRHLWVDAQFDLLIDGCGGQFNMPESMCPMNRHDYPEDEVKIMNKDWRFTLGAGWRWNL